MSSLLAQYQRLIRTTLLNNLPAEKEPRRYLYDLVLKYPQRSGKYLRPALCIATCQAVGGQLEAALLPAVAIELLHNGFLIHDDVEDGSEYRRGRPTLHTDHGIGLAVNAGDAMYALAIGMLMKLRQRMGIRLIWQILDEFENMVRRTLEGQATELGWALDNVCALSEVDYLRMTLNKTCWYTCIYPCRIGALIASNGNFPLNRFDRFGFYMGAAFQIQDDVLNLVGDRKRYGKEIYGDLWEGKRTLAIIHVLNECHENERERVSKFLGTPRSDRKARDVSCVLSLIRKYDGIGFSRSVARQLAGAALREFYVAYGDLPESTYKRLVRDIVFYMVGRQS